MKKTTLILLVVAAVAGLSLVAGGDDEATTSIPDSDFSLYPGSVFEVPTPPAFQENQARPGSNALLQPMFTGAPPQVPHTVQEFLPIEVEDHGCLACHLVEREADEEAPVLPESHRLDLRADPPRALDRVAGARWVCTACHVAVTDAAPLAQSAGAR